MALGFSFCLTKFCGKKLAHLSLILQRSICLFQWCGKTRTGAQGVTPPWVMNTFIEHTCMSGCLQEAEQHQSSWPALSVLGHLQPEDDWAVFLFSNVGLWAWLCLVKRMRDWLKSAALCRLHLVKRSVPNSPDNFYFLRYWSISLVFRFGEWDSWVQLGVTKPRDDAEA